MISVLRSILPLSKNQDVVCIACGDEIEREQAREYDKHGNRWNRDGKEFEYMCRSCHRSLSNLPRDDLEEKVVDADEMPDDPHEFAKSYVERHEEVER